MRWIKPERYLDKAEKAYLLQGEKCFNFPLRYSREMREHSPQVEAELKKYPFLKISSYQNKKEGYARVGRASEIGFELSDLLKQRPHLKEIKQGFEEACQVNPGWDLLGFVRRHYEECKKKAFLLPAMVRVLDYLFKNSKEVAGFYPRQIPHGQSTKLIAYEGLLLSLYSEIKEGKNKKSKNISWEKFYREFGLRYKPRRFEFLAERAFWEGSKLQGVHGLLTSENYGLWDFGHLKASLIVENEESFFPLKGLMPECLILWGGGKKIAGADFLRESLPKPIFYWGDMDKEGYEIFALVAELFEKVIPVGMDQESMERYWDLRQCVPVRSKSPKAMPQLAESYEKVCQEGLQIEQEQIELNWIIKKVTVGIS